jgi:hypothetical protein
MGKQAKSATAYVVLQQLDGHDEAWMPVGRASGHTKTEAIKAVAREKAGPEEEYLGGTFRAVPARSWPSDPDFGIANERRTISVFTQPGGRAEDQKPATAGARGDA